MGQRSLVGKQLDHSWCVLQVSHSSLEHFKVAKCRRLHAFGQFLDCPLNVRSVLAQEAKPHGVGSVGIGLVRL